MSDVHVRGASVAFPGVTAVDDVTLDIPSGTTLAILGPSGSGKSSLLRAIAGLEPLAGGSVLIDGQDQSGRPAHRRGVGLMFQDHALFPNMDVADNVAFGLRMQGRSRGRSRGRVGQMLTLVGLSDRAGADVTELSGGEQQRVALARTLAPGPRIVLLDEPLGSLDRVLREELMVVMADAFSATGATALLVTHDQTEAFAMGDEVAIMRAGRLRQIAAPRAIWESPRDAWVARFLGMSNLFGARDPVTAAVGADGHVLLRPDRLLLAAPDSDVDGHVARLPGTVLRTRFRGGFNDARVALTGQAALGQGGPVEVDVWSMRDTPAPGEQVVVAVPASAIVSLGE